MKPRLVIFLLILFTAPPGLAGTGDRYFISEDGTPLLRAPIDNGAIVTILSLDREVVELNRDGAWVMVGLTDNKKIEGWVPVFHLSAKRTIPLPPPPKDDAFDTFVTEIETFNEEIMNHAVNGLYWNVRRTGKGEVELTITYTWLRFNHEERKANLKYLLYLWDRVNEEEMPLTVRIVDLGGQEIMNMRQK